MDYGAIAAGAAGATSGVFGTLFNYRESKNNRREARRQFDQQMNESIQRRVADGLKAGINPLAAIGASTNVTPTMSTSGPSGTGDMITETGGKISKFLQSLFDRKARNDVKYDEESKALDLEGQRLDNRIKAARLTEIQHNLSPSGSKETPDFQPTRTGDQPLFSIAYDLRDRPRLVVNQNVMESDSDNAGYLASIKHALSTGLINPISGEINSDQERMRLDDMYYNMTGRHIQNLDKLYFAPSEGAFGTAILLRGI